MEKEELLKAEIELAKEKLMAFKDDYRGNRKIFRDVNRKRGQAILLSQSSPSPFPHSPKTRCIL